MNYVLKTQSFSNLVLILLRHLAEKSKFCWTVNRSVCTPAPWRSPQSPLWSITYTTYALPHLCKSLLSYTPDHEQAADQKIARSFVKTAIYSWKTELVQTQSSGCGGTSATCPRRLREKPSVPVLGQEDIHKHYKDIRVLG